MLTEAVATFVKKLGITGLLHIGANLCQELDMYRDSYGLDPARITWIEAIPSIAELATRNGVQNVYQAVLSDSSGVVDFHVTNNIGLSSSILKLYAHKFYHPYVHVQEVLKLSTKTLSEWIREVGLEPDRYEMMVMDIQGAELKVLSGSPEALRTVKMIVTEINLEELYKDCGLYTDLVLFLKEHGFVEVAKETNEHMWGDALFVRAEYV